MKRYIYLLSFFIVIFFAFAQKGMAQAASATWALTTNATAAGSGNVTATSATKGSSVGALSYGATGMFATGFTTSSTMDGNAYYQYTISPASGNDLTVTSISLTANYNGSVNMYTAVSYSLNNFSTSTSLASSITINPSTATNLSYSPSIAVPNGSTLTVRVYGYYTDATTYNFYNKNVVISGTTISTCTAPANPGNPTSNSPQCTSPGVTLTRTGSPPAGEIWYWQTSATGTSTANSGSTYNVTTSGTYYIRSQTTATSCWSAGAGSLAVTVNAVPTCAASPSPASGTSGVSTAGTTLSWTAVAGITGYYVYLDNSATPTTLVSTQVGTSYATGALSSNSTFYWKIVPYNSCGPASGCSTQNFSTPCTSTFLISPTAEGGFENGATLAANGWTVVDASVVTWYVGTGAGSQAGTKAAYVSSDGTTYAATTASAVIKHFYRDVVIPSGATNVYLNYYLKMPIIDCCTYDYFYIYTTTNTTTISAGALPTGTVQATYNTPALAGFNAQPQIDLTALAGSTVRLVFTYQSDAAANYANPAVDNISLTYCSPCTTPGTPASVAGTATGQTSANLSWAANATVGSPTVTYYWAVGPLNTVTYASGYTDRGTTTSLSSSTSVALTCGTNYYLSVYAQTSCNSTNSTAALSSVFTTSACCTGGGVGTAGPDQYLCAGTVATMAATGTGTWSQISGAAAGISTTGSATTGITGLASGTYSFRWSCGSTYDDMIIVVK